MREIKFRGYSKKYKRWFYGCLLIDETQKSFYIVDNMTGIAVEVEKETIGQYTGLHDKNGKEIYEGDIVKFLNKYSDDEPRSKSKVYTFDGTPFCIDVETGEYDVITLAWAMKQNIEDVEIIGNIHDNPELLEVKDE